MFHLDFDYGAYIVNLSRDAATGESVKVGDYSSGFQKTVYGYIEVGLGAQLQFWYSNIVDMIPAFWGHVGAMPIIGKQAESVRSVSTLEKAEAIRGR